MPRGNHRLRHIVAQPLLHRFDARKAHSHNPRLRVDRLPQVILRPVEHNVRKRPLQRIVNTLEHLTRRRRLVIKLLTHPYGLRSLSREQVAHLRPLRLRHKTESHLQSPVL